MAAPLRSTLAAGNVVLLGRIRSFNLCARGKDLLRRSVDVGLHDDGLLTARPCRSSVSRQRTGIHPLEPFAAVVARAGFGSRRAERFPPTLPANFYMQKSHVRSAAMCAVSESRCRGFNSTGIAIGFLESAVQVRGIMHFHANYVSTSVFGDGDTTRPRSKPSKMRMTLAAHIS